MTYSLVWDYCLFVRLANGQFYCIYYILVSYRYDPSTDSWSVVVAMNTRRSGVGLCVLEDKLYAMGGFDGCTYLKSVEWFDSKQNQWRMATSMNYRRLGCGVGKLKVTNTAPFN